MMLSLPLLAVVRIRNAITDIRTKKSTSVVASSRIHKLHFRSLHIVFTFILFGINNTSIACQKLCKFGGNAEYIDHFNCVFNYFHSAHSQTIHTLTERLQSYALPLLLSYGRARFCLPSIVTLFVGALLFFVGPH